MAIFVKRKPARALLVALLTTAVALLSAAQPNEPEPFDYSAYVRVLSAYVTPEGLVRYPDLKANPKDLNIFIRQLKNVSPASHPERFSSPDARMAYWINAYNAFALYAVVEAYPVKSVRDLKFGFGFLFFKRTRFVAGGKAYSLDDIEHGILRRRFSDPRIHFAVNCASTSCPPLQREPFAPERLDEQLEEAARRFIGSQENVWMRGDVLFLSSLFDWYGEDFREWLAQRGTPQPTVVDYVTRYLAEPVAERVRREKPPVEFYDYNWTLNDATVPTD